MSTYRLKYLFKAFYRDGGVCFQNEDDKARIFPGRSAYSDVDQDRLQAFALEGNGIRLVCDLDTGRFTVNGAAVIDPEGRPQRAVTPKRLIYFRRVSQEMNTDFTEKEEGCRVTYHMGWQANDSEGNNIQYTMELR